jgi:hypothetical protein
MATPWSIAMLARMLALNGGKLSTAEIAGRLSVEFDNRVTKNAVVGKCHRLGLRSGRNWIKHPFRQPPPPIAERIAMPDETDDAAGVPLIDLQWSQCRYPVTDALPFLFCGHKTDELRSYCDEHHALCHAGSRERQKAATGTFKIMKLVSAGL